MKVLIVDDNKVQAESLELTIKDMIEPVTVITHQEFASAFDLIEAEAPDAVVLDIYHGDPSSGHPAGNDLRAEIWEKHFCPLVIYTAKPDDSHYEMAKHPFVRVIEKAGKLESDQAVVGELKQFEPHINTLRRIRDDTIRTIGGSLRHVCGSVWSDSQDNTTRLELIDRITRRRVAAAMDLTESTTPIRSWERYVYPPICADLLTGDILQERLTTGDIAQFRLVVSPSCDMVRSRANCLEKVLVARCEAPPAYMQAAGLPAGTKEKTLRKRLPSELNALQTGGYVCLPALPEVFPLMAVNFKNLELIDHSQVGFDEGTDKRFRRIVSVDSPFRETIAWAFAQIIARPALPDIDHSATIEGLVESSGGQSGGGDDAEGD